MCFCRHILNFARRHENMLSPAHVYCTTDCTITMFILIKHLSSYNFSTDGEPHSSLVCTRQYEKYWLLMASTILAQNTSSVNFVQGWDGDEQRGRIPCIQDPPEIPLYTMIGQSKEGWKTLPIYRCARGATSLESFHLHLARFIPGNIMIS
jgi:hypothetical protein